MIQVSHLTKYYGDSPAVTDLSFEIGEGHVYGFLGPNGAGKSTTMNIMTGCLSPTEGTVRIGDYDILEQPEQAKRLIGYLPELPPLYPNETPQEYLSFVGEAKGLKGKKLRESIDRVVERTGIEDVRDQLIGTLSKGYRQRVGIAQALIGDPAVIILDEPTVGLDPIQIIEIRDLIRELGRSHTVILSSHILSEVQAVCDQVLIISEGKLAAFDTPENLQKILLASGGVLLRAEAEKAAAEEILAGVEGLQSWEIREEDGTLTITAELSEGQTARTVCGRLTMAFSEKGCPVFEIRTRKANLEDVFLELTEGDTAEGSVPAAGNEETTAGTPETAADKAEASIEATAEENGKEEEEQ